jgi:DNA-binding response OmpR family regulator
MPTILVVDDEQELLTTFDTILTQEGYRVRTTSDPEKALQLLDLERPQLVLLDINLPRAADKTDGLDLLCRMRERMPQVAVIIVSGYVDEVTRQVALDAGAIDCWPKPVNLQVLKQRVAQVVAGPKTPPKMG